MYSAAINDLKDLRNESKMLMNQSLQILDLSSMWLFGVNFGFQA
jgi:hypothetical protein